MGEKGKPRKREKKCGTMILAGKRGGKKTYGCPHGGVMKEGGGGGGSTTVRRKKKFSKSWE